VILSVIHHRQNPLESKFKGDQTALNDDPIQRTSHTDENCVIVEGLIRENRRVKICEIAEVTGIVISTMHKIISDLNFCSLSPHWVPRMLAEKHKSRRMAPLLENLCHCQNKGESFVESIITGHETSAF
jgi:hypothetical protein